MNRIARLLILCVALSLFAQSPVGYHVTRTYALGGDGGWDYIVPEPAQHRVFIGRANRVMVVDADNGKLLGEVTGINGAAILPRARLAVALRRRRVCDSVVSDLAMTPVTDDEDLEMFHTPSAPAFLAQEQRRHAHEHKPEHAAVA